MDKNKPINIKIKSKKNKPKIQNIFNNFQSEIPNYKLKNSQTMQNK